MLEFLKLFCCLNLHNAHLRLASPISEEVSSSTSTDALHFKIILQQESITVECASPACTNHTYFNRHQMSVLLEGGYPGVNKFEQVFRDGLQMSLAGVGPGLEVSLRSDVLEGGGP